MNSQKKLGALFIILVLTLTSTIGCTSHSKTYKNESTDAAGQTVVQETETTTTEHRDYGIVGGAFHLVGEVFAFPFDVIAGLFRFIF